MEIRKATADDLGGIIEVWKTFMDYHKDIDPLFTRSENAHERFKQYITEQIKKEDVFLFVYIQNNKVEGYTLGEKAAFPPVFVRTSYCMITDIAVTPACRGKGIGKKLFEKVKDWAQEKQLDRIELRAASANAPTLSFYEKLGFKEYLKVMYLEI